MDSWEAAKIVGPVVLALITAFLGKPIVMGLRQRRTAEERSGEDRARLSSTEYRATDDLIKRMSADAERMRSERDDALEAKKQALIDADAHIQIAQKQVDAARQDVHDIRNASMISIAATETAAKAEIKRIEHAAEAKIFSVRAEMTVLLQKLQERDEMIVRLTAKYEECSARNDELTRRLERWGPRKSDIGQGLS